MDTWSSRSQDSLTDAVSQLQDSSCSSRGNETSTTYTKLWPSLLFWFFSKSSSVMFFLWESSLSISLFRSSSGDQWLFPIESVPLFLPGSAPVGNLVKKQTASPAASGTPVPGNSCAVGYSLIVQQLWCNLGGRRVYYSTQHTHYKLLRGQTQTEPWDHLLRGRQLARRVY